MYVGSYELLTRKGINKPRIVLFSLISGFGSSKLLMGVAISGVFLFYWVKVIAATLSFFLFPFLSDPVMRLNSLTSPKYRIVKVGFFAVEGQVPAGGNVEDVSLSLSLLRPVKVSVCVTK